MWFYYRDGQQQGPVSREELQAMAKEGRLSPNDAVWTDGMTHWQPAQTVAGLFPDMPARQNTDDLMMRIALPVGRSVWAIIAGYLGLFSVLLIFAPISLIVSLIALNDIKKHPEKLGKGRAIFGLIMGGLGTTLLLWLLILSLARN